MGGGRQRRSFTWIGDGVEALEAIIRNENSAADGEIFNIGNPANNASIKELALAIIRVLKELPQYRHFAEQAQLKEIDSKDYYGKGYEDVQDRVPSIDKAKRLLGWTPTHSLEEAVRKTVTEMLRNR